MRIVFTALNYLVDKSNGTGSVSFKTKNMECQLGINDFQKTSHEAIFFTTYLDFPVTVIFFSDNYTY